MLSFKIGSKIISKNSPTYFIADIAANHDGNLARAKKLIKLCAEAGADAAKFQHFKADTIVSKSGFDKMKKITHQANWKKSVYQVYKDASIDPNWTEDLIKTCKKYKIDFMTAPYDLDYIDELDKKVCAFKIGSGDITWEKSIYKISKKNKPVIIATGASDIKEVRRAVNVIFKNNKKIVLMQCNTNYTNSLDNFKHLNLNVLNQYKKIFNKRVILGLSDHTPGNISVLAGVSLGARVIEKHFTDNNSRSGPDHKFSMNPKSWKEMVISTRILEKSMGDGIKKVERNELQSKIVQRRGLWLINNIKKNQRLKETDVIALRPCPNNAFNPFDLKKIINKRAKINLKKGDYISKSCLK
tara:strand:- start:435 stop:1502 length:1068 start_codon:yes stop_codon:yes gene_type:complete